MNCERFQESLYDYLDDALSPDEKAAAQLHLATCSTCRQTVENERFVARTLSARLNESVESVTLESHAQRTMANAVRSQIQNAPDSKTTFVLRAWVRLAIPGALILIAAVWFGHALIGHKQLLIPTSPASAESHVRVYLSYSEPHYTFRQKGTMVVDALTSDTRVADGPLLAKK